MGALEPAKSRMVAECPRCRARYRVLPERLPRQGARLRCVLCRAGFRVRLPRPARVAPRSAPHSAATAFPSHDEQAAAPLEAPEVSVGFPLPGDRPDPVTSESVGDPAAAQRLARIMTAELVLYHRERFDAGMQAGDVLTAMAPEIEEGRVLLAQRMGADEDARQLLDQEILRVADERGFRPSD